MRSNSVAPTTHTDDPRSKGFSNRALMQLLRLAGPPVAFALIVGVAWEAYVRLMEVPAYIFPAPSRIIDVIITDFGRLVYHSSITFVEAVAGFFIGSLLGGLFGITFAYSKWAARGVLPYVIAANTIPVVAIAPIFIIWFGHGIESKIAVTAFLSFFPLSLNMMKGLQSYDPLAMDLFHVCAANEWQRFWKMRLPSALPYVFVGLKLNVTFSVIGAIIAEFVQADRGLGFLIMTTYRLMNMPTLWAAMFASAVLGITFFALVLLAERLAIPWHSSMRNDPR